MRLSLTIRSHATVLLHALDIGVVLTLSVATGLATFFQTNDGPSCHRAGLCLLVPCSNPISP